MKLRNKLLPLTGIAAIAATAAPIGLTSCGSKMTMTDITKGYVPTLKSSVEDYLNRHDANKVYKNDIENNSDIFHQDLLYGMYTRYKSFEGKSGDVEYIYDLKNLKVGHTTPSFGMVNISYPGEPDVQYPTISFGLCVDMTFTEEWLYSGSYYKTETSKSYNVEYKNIPFYGYVFDGEWNFGVKGALKYDTYVYQYLMSDYSIAYSYNETSTNKKVSQSESYEYTTSKSESDVLNSYKKISNMMHNHILDDIAFEYPSYYMSGVKQLPEVYIQTHLIATAESGGANVTISPLTLYTSDTAKINSIVLNETSDVVLKQTDELEEGETQKTITIKQGAELKRLVNNYYSIPATLDAPVTVTEATTYTFSLPKSFNIKITCDLDVGEETVTKEISQTVYTNAEEMVLTVTTE